VPATLLANPLYTTDLPQPSRASAFSADDWVFELKYDGYRLLAVKDGARVELRYRTGRQVTDLYPEVVRTIACLPATRAVFDGELVVFDAAGRSNFGLLRSRAFGRPTPGRRQPPARVCLFDLLMLDDQDLRPRPLLERKRALQGLLARQTEVIFVKHVARVGEQLLAGARRFELEGVVAKAAERPYPRGRTKSWLKVKLEDTGDFVVVGIAPPSRETFDRPGLVLALPGAGACDTPVASPWAARSWAPSVRSFHTWRSRSPCARPRWR
jgi:bifunctional non-homologous end joining protein LigD